jgi:DNA replication protein DnaC
MVRRVRATYSIPPDQPYHETEEMVYHQLRGVRLLVLDDVGKEKPSTHTREVYFYIIDERLKLGLPVLITSNLPVEGPGSLEELMGRAVVSRLIGMCQGNCFELKGEDFRRRKKKP